MFRPFVLLFIPVLLAKDNLVKITIDGADLPAPVQVTDSRVVPFYVWAGPGVRVNGVEETAGFIIDWAKGTAGNPPAGLPHYQVSFYAGPSSKPSLVYVVAYNYDASLGQGFVYLPGPGDEMFAYNHAMWHGYGLEGHWFRPTREWENFVHPLIAAGTSKRGPMPAGSR